VQRRQSFFGVVGIVVVIFVKIFVVFFIFVVIVVRWEEGQDEPKVVEHSDMRFQWGERRNDDAGKFV